MPTSSPLPQSLLPQGALPDQRQKDVEQWLATVLPGQTLRLEAASSDASFRRYFRLIMSDGQTRIVMDAPPSSENVRPWLDVQGVLAAAGVHVPAVLAAEPTRGFLLLSDLGDTTYLRALGNTPNASQTEADTLYRQAIEALLRMQKMSRPSFLPEYDRAMLMQEMQLFPDWYVSQHCQTTLNDTQQAVLAQTFTSVLAVNVAEPKVFVHRDYHSRNLMQTLPCPGIIDFQDAVYGPMSYDLVSLFKDAYIEWEEAQILDWLVRYWQQARQLGLPVRADFADFFRDFEWMGVQRHIKVLGIFARLYHRDGKTSYLNNMPLVEKYLRATCARYSPLTPFLHLLDDLAGRQMTTGYTF